MMQNDIFGKFVAVAIFLGLGYLAVTTLWDKWTDHSVRGDMMESCFEALPKLEITLDNLNAEINLWENEKDKFTKMKEVSTSDGARNLANSKINRVINILYDLKNAKDNMIQEAEMIALEKADNFSELDLSSLKNLETKINKEVMNSEQLREEFNNARSSY
ncbi:hypothetical protein N9N55_07870 [Opitutales bacterium]|nr:hypothetical protein [Opitutales bacterium]